MAMATRGLFAGPRALSGRSSFQRGTALPGGVSQSFGNWPCFLRWTAKRHAKKGIAGAEKRPARPACSGRKWYSYCTSFRRSQHADQPAHFGSHRLHRRRALH